MKDCRIEILTEEKSMELFLMGLLPRLLPEGYQLGVNCFIRTHDGKSHLQKSIPLKMKAFQQFPTPVKVLIVHDQDSNDCLILKSKLLSLAVQGSQQIPVVVRIACRELENWYLGDFESLGQLYTEVKAGKYAQKSKYRNPDSVFGAQELKALSRNFSKSEAARALGTTICIESNRSPSFRQLVSGLHKLINND
jgi:Domain of unknown function (DUF4276)